MSDPYRDPAKSDQLAALRKLPAALMPRVLARVIVYTRWPYPVVVKDKVKASIEEAGMQYLGNCMEWLLTVPLASRVWVDRAQTTQVRASLRGYWLCTYFESGDCVLTWDHPPRTEANARLEVYGTRGSFALDYEAHLEVVNRKREAGDAPIVVRDLSTALALGRHYYRFVASTGLAMQLLVLPLLIIVTVIVGILRWSSD